LLFPFQVLVRTWPTPAIPNQYFRIMDPDLPMVIDDAGNFYEQEEYEQASLEQVSALLTASCRSVFFSSHCVQEGHYEQEEYEQASLEQVVATYYCHLHN
jgi:hypothetical protein